MPILEAQIARVVFDWIADPFSVYGCLSDVISLSCSDGRTIDLTDAVYGMYADTCASCCAPHPIDDCTENVQDYPGDWVELMFWCQNRTSCQYEYRGSTVDACQMSYIADYIQIQYNCQPGDNPILLTFFIDVSDVVLPKHYNYLDILNGSSIKYVRTKGEGGSEPYAFAYE